MTVDEAIAAVVKVAKGELNYNPGRTYSKYGEWYGPGWKNALWCAAGASWCFYRALGATAAKAVIGFQADGPNKRGFVWTVAWLEWLERNGAQKVGPKNVRPGDLVFFRFPTTGSRTRNRVNHVDLAVGYFDAKTNTFPTIGFNTPKPGTAGDPSNGRGVWAHKRSASNRYIVAIMRPLWNRLPKDAAAPKGNPSDLEVLGYPNTVAGVKAFQKDRGLVVDGIVGPKTLSEIGKVMSEVLTLLKQIQRQTDPAKPYTADDGLTAEQADKYRYTSRAKLLAYAADAGFVGVKRIDSVKEAVRKAPADVVAAIRPALVKAAEDALKDVMGPSVELDANMVAEAVANKLAQRLAN